MVLVQSLPAYTTITSQSYTEDGEYLAIANDQGRVAIFKVPQIIDKESKGNAIFQFDAASILDGPTKGYKGCVNALKTIKDNLIVAISRPIANREAAIVAFSWNDLVNQRTKLLWNIDHSFLPTDVNAMDVNKTDEKLFVVGGVGTAQAPMKDYAVRCIDLETRMEMCKPCLGHDGYLHSVNYCPSNKMVATCGEDGTARVFDVRSNRPLINTLEPGKDAKLARPKLGEWLGDVQIEDDWLITGGGPRAAIFHLRAAGISVVPELPDTCQSIFVTKLIEDRLILGGQFMGKMFHFNMSGDLMAEVKTTSPCLYTVEHTEQSEFKLLSAAGASAHIDLSCHNYSYSDKYITFPAI